MSIVDCFNSNKHILLEGALSERLKSLDLQNLKNSMIIDTAAVQSICKFIKDGFVTKRLTTKPSFFLISLILFIGFLYLCVNLVKLRYA